MQIFKQSQRGLLIQLQRVKIGAGQCVRMCRTKNFATLLIPQ